jgi:chemotaxis signal transduction protein
MDQDKAVETYLGVLLDDGFDDKSSAERAADNIAGLLNTTDSVIEDQPECDEPAYIEEENASMEVRTESESSSAVEVPPARLTGEDSDSLQGAVMVNDEAVHVDEAESSLPEIDYQDRSDDPEVIAEAEKMLSFVFPQPMAEENTPLRKLQEAGVIKVAEMTPQEIENDRQSDSPAELVPLYASDRFTMMAFRINGLKLLVSVTELRNVKKVEGELSAIPGKPAWLYQYPKPEGGTGFIANGEQLFVADAPPLKKQDLENKFIVWMLNGQFGVLCDEAQEMVDINRRQVSWRGSKTSKPWCAGTIRSMKAVLLDAESLWQEIDGLF